MKYRIQQVAALAFACLAFAGCSTTREVGHREVTYNSMDLVEFPVHGTPLQEEQEILYFGHGKPCDFIDYKVCSMCSCESYAQQGN